MPTLAGFAEFNEQFAPSASDIQPPKDLPCDKPQALLYAELVSGEHVPHTRAMCRNRLNRKFNNRDQYYYSITDLQRGLDFILYLIANEITLLEPKAQDARSRHIHIAPPAEVEQGRSCQMMLYRAMEFNPANENKRRDLVVALVDRIRIGQNIRTKINKFTKVYEFKDTDPTNSGESATHAPPSASVTKIIASEFTIDAAAGPSGRPRTPARP